MCSFRRKPTRSPTLRQVVSWFISLLGHTCLQHRYSDEMYVVALPIPTHYVKLPYRSFCRHHRPFRPAYNTPNGQVPRMGSSKISFLRVWLLVFPEPWSIQHQGTYSNCHHDQRRGGWCRDHGYLLCYAHPLRCQVVGREAIPPGNIIPDIWLFLCRRSPPIPRLALKYDLARRPRPLCSAKHHAFKLRKERYQAHVKRALPIHRMHLQLRVVLVPRISVDRTQHFQLGLLDRPKQYRRQQYVWLAQRSRNGSGLVRLGSDIFDWQSSRSSGMFGYISSTTPNAHH